MKRFTAFFAALLLAASFFGCENVTPGRESVPEDEGSRDAYREIESMLPPAIEDESGEFSDTQTITLATDEPCLFLSDEETPTAYRTHLSERNAYLSKRYGIELAVRKESNGNAPTALLEAVNSGLPYAEILAFGVNDTLKLWSQGLLYDMCLLPGFDPTSSAYDAKNACELAANTAFYMLPDASCYWFDEINVMFCNSKLLDSSLESPLSLAARGEWTWDAFTEHCKAAYAVSKGVFGFGTYADAEDYAGALWTSSGKRIITDTYKKPVRLSMEPSDISETAAALKKHYDTYYRYPETKASAVNQFENGGMIFFSNKLDYFYSLRDGSEKGLEYLLLPMPKLYSESEDCSCLVSNSARVYSVPSTAEKFDRQTAVRINAYLAVACASGAPAAKKAFVGTFIANYLTGNDETLALRAIIDGAAFDFAQVYGSESWEIRYCTTKVISDYIGFGSEVANSIRHARDNFERYVEAKFNAGDE